MNFPAHKVKTYGLHKDCKQPGYRIRDEKEIQCSVVWKYPINPHNPRSYSTDDRKDHWYCGMTHAS